jgi:hypothetical protein
MRTRAEDAGRSNQVFEWGFELEVMVLAPTNEELKKTDRISVRILGAGTNVHCEGTVWGSRSDDTLLKLHYIS